MKQYSYQDLNAIPDEEIVKFLAGIANELEPVKGAPSFEEQQRRLNTWPFLLFHMATRLQNIISKKDERIRQIREELISVRKELTRLKRNK